MTFNAQTFHLPVHAVFVLWYVDSVLCDSHSACAQGLMFLSVGASALICMCDVLCCLHILDVNKSWEGKK